jgi:poly-gamma-glutamate system protein
MPEKMAATTRTVRCFEAIRQYRLGSPSGMDMVNDPEGSGLIGEAFTLTTTDRGILESKLTSVNPNFAALFVQYFQELGLQAGDPVAIAMTGSFPALNIAVLVAAEELSLLPLPITSVGASMWGANDPSFTWLDMETLLNERGLLRTRSLAASLGGSNDRGRGLSPKGRALLQGAIVRNEVPLIARQTLDESIQERISIFDREAEPRGIRAYINIGGSSASIGTQLDGSLIRPGPSLKIPDYNWTQRGALHHYAKRRVPIIHILQIQTIARKHGFPIAPETVPSVGEGTIFHKEMYDLKVVLPSFLLYLLLCVGMLRSRKRAARSARERVTGVAIGLIPSGAEPSGPWPRTAQPGGEEDLSRTRSSPDL